MLKKILAFAAMLYAAASFAAVDANRATAAELDGVKGVGPATSQLIVNERAKAPFAGWDDFIARVKGIGGNRAAKLSAEGLTVNGAAYQRTAASTAAADKPAGEKIKDEARAIADKTESAAKTAAHKTGEALKDVKEKVTGK
jgi:competence protein ComEA